MRNYTVCICDDEMSARKLLRRFTIQYSFTYNVDIKIIELDSAEKLKEGDMAYDILFLDIRFNGRDIGIDVAQGLRERGNSAIIILVTAFKAMSIDGYRAEPFRFLLKPVKEEEVVCVLHSCMIKLNRRGAYLKVTSDYSSELIRTDRIMCNYSQLRKRFIVCTNDQVIETWKSLNEVMESLPRDKFLLSHKGYIVNLDMVDTVKYGQVTLINGVHLPLGNRYKDAFMKGLLKNVNI